MAVVFVSHAYSGDPETNCRTVERISRGLALQGHPPFAPQLLFPHFIDEISERDLALKLCLQLVAAADELRIYGNPSEGMRLEIAEARRLGIPVAKGELP